MEYREIVAVTGIGGLFQLLSTKSDGAIVRNLSDKSTKFIAARVHNVTPIESIEIYTTDENVRLHSVLQAMKEHEATIPLVNASKGDSKAIKAYFQAVFPNLDEDRVYVSDMKKIVKWYSILKENDLLDFSTIDQKESAEATEEIVDAGSTTEEVIAEKPAKKATKTKKAAGADASGEPVAKKTARKKKSEE